MNSKTLITGATGLLGSHLLLHLLQKNSLVKAMYRNENAKEHVKTIFAYYTTEVDELYSKIEWIKGDVCDYYGLEEALENVDTVYHCAGFISFDKKDRDQLFEINATGTANLVNACLHKGNIKLCHVSSIASINNADYKAPLNETVFWKTKGQESNYAKSKYNGEREVWRGIEEGLDACIVNPGIILGPGFWNQSSGQLFKLGQKGQLFYTKGISAYVDVLDVVACMYLLMEQKKMAQRYIIIEGNYSFKTVLTWLNMAFGKAPPKYELGAFLLHLVGFLSRIKQGLNGGDALSRETIQSAQNTQTYANDKLKKELNYAFTSTENCIKRIGLIYSSSQARS